MRLIPAISLVAMLATGSAFAADNAATSATAKPARAASSECAKQADEKKLKGSARTDFLKTCKSDGKTK